MVVTEAYTGVSDHGQTPKLQQTSKAKVAVYSLQKNKQDSHATTLPPNLPTPKTLAQSLPSTRTVLHASSPSLSLILVLGCSCNPSSPPTWSGSSSGFVNPFHLLSIVNAPVSTLILKTPCALADSMSRDCELEASVSLPARLGA